MLNLIGKDISRHATETTALMREYYIQIAVFQQPNTKLNLKNRTTSLNPS